MLASRWSWNINLICCCLGAFALAGCICLACLYPRTSQSFSGFSWRPKWAFTVRPSPNTCVKAHFAFRYFLLIPFLFDFSPYLQYLVLCVHVMLKIMLGKWVSSFTCNLPILLIVCPPRTWTLWEQKLLPISFTATFPAPRASPGP